MPVATRAVHLDADHAVAGIALFGDAPLLDRAHERGPSGARIELVARAEERRTATTAIEGAVAMLAPKRARERWLGPLGAQDLVLLSRQTRAPLRIGELEARADRRRRIGDVRLRRPRAG